MIRKAALATLLAAQLTGPAPAAPQEIAEPRAYVSNKDALFVFDVPDKDRWHWFGPETRTGAMEYGWTIEVGTTTKYVLGFSLYKPGAAAVADSGSLKELIARGQRTLWTADPVSGGLKAAPPIDLQVTAMNGQVLLHLNDEDVVHMLFGGKPETVNYDVVLHGRRWSGGETPIRYTRADFKLWSGPDDTDAAAVGARAPEFDLPILGPFTGEQRLQLSDLAGEVIVLYFWTSHCPVSRAEFDEVMSQARQWLQRGVKVVGVTTRQDPQADRAFLATSKGEGITHVVASPSMEDAYGAWGTPYIVLIDAAGRIAYRAMSAGQWSEGGILARKLDRLLEERSSTSRSSS